MILIDDTTLITQMVKSIRSSHYQPGIGYALSTIPSINVIRVTQYKLHDKYTNLFIFIMIV